MVSISVLLCLLGSFFLYSTSAKMRSVNTEFQFLKEARLRVRKVAGAVLWIASFVVLAIYAGVGAAIAYFLLVLTLALSLIILLYPLKVLNKFGLFVILFLSLAIEFLV